MRKTCSGLARETNEASKLGTSLSMGFLFFKYLQFLKPKVLAKKNLIYTKKSKFSTQKNSIIVFFTVRKFA